jgi:transcriptional regulator with XRE-family HTH domain
MDQIFIKSKMQNGQIATLLSVGAGTVSRWLAGKTFPSPVQLRTLRQVFRIHVTDEQWSQLFNYRNISLVESEHLSRSDHQFPSDYPGPVYTWLEPMPEYRDVEHEFTLEWINPTNPNGGARFDGKIYFEDDYQINILYTKWNATESFPMRIDVFPPCRIAFGEGTPKSGQILDLDRVTWVPIRPEKDQDSAIVLYLPFPKEFSDRFPFQIGDVFYVVVGEKEGGGDENPPIKIEMDGHSLILDLSRMWPEL